MPSMDGFEATKAIRKIEASKGTYTPIIAVTALAMVGDRERCIAVGMDDYISKPMNRQVLKIKLNHWMQREFVLRNQELARKYAQVAPLKVADEQIRSRRVGRILFQRPRRSSSNICRKHRRSFARDERCNK